MPKIEFNGPDFKYVVSWYPDDNPFAIQRETVGRADAWHHVVRNTMPTFKKYWVRVKAKNTKGDSRVEAPWVPGYTGEGGKVAAGSFFHNLFNLIIKYQSSLLIKPAIDTKILKVLR